MKKFITTVIVALMCHISYGQKPTSINYKISYNSSSCKYEAYMHVNAVTSGLAFPGSAQFTIVVPASMSSNAVTSVVSKNPSTSGWSNGGSASSSSNDFYSIIYNPQAGAAYPTGLSAGDSVLLFDFSLNNDVCASNVRPWSSSDPSSPGTSSGNFANGINISFAPVYSGNEASNAPVAAPSINSLSPNCSSSSKGIALSASGNGIGASCGTLSYAWTGPNSFTATTANISVLDSNISIGQYNVMVTDAFGCAVSDSITIDSSNCFTLPVPVSLMSFDGHRINNVNKLFWTTANEVNNQHFIVERKIGDGEFEPIGTVESLAPGGNSKSVLNYSFNDYDVMTPNVTVLYMLKQVDFDQEFEYYGPVRINTDENLAITAYPNPAIDIVNIAGLNDEFDYTVKVYDLVGKVLIDSPISANEPVIDVGFLSTGVYNVVVTTNSGIELSTKVIIGD
jgi:hypothetical protein